MNKMPCLQLTRGLYPKDEAELSLLFAILERQPCETCLFWACELIYSGFDIAPLIWSLYYDFYAQLNPGMVVRVADALKKLRGGNETGVLMLIKTLRVKKATDNVFSLRISQAPTKYTVYRGRIPGWLAGFPAEQRPLLRAICNYDWNQIMLYVGRKSCGNAKEVVKSILRVMMSKGIIAMKDMGTGVSGAAMEDGDDTTSSPTPDDIVEALWNNHGYADEYHIVLALIVSLVTPDTLCDFGRKLIKLNEREKEYVASLVGVDGGACDGGSAGQVGMNRLLSRRLCKVNDYVNAFDTVRGEAMDARAFSRELTDNWPFHCSRTPYWQGVFAKYGVVAKCAEKEGHGCEVEFACGNGMESDFWSKYGFLCDLDEPALERMWASTCASMCESASGGCDGRMDVVDVLEEVFGGDGCGGGSGSVEELRMEFDDVTLSSRKRPYGIGSESGCGSEGAGVGDNKFDFSVLSKVLDGL